MDGWGPCAFVFDVFAFLCVRAVEVQNPRNNAVTNTVTWQTRSFWITGGKHGLVAEFTYICVKKVQ